ncbi:MAG: WYL domain-containing protein [Actinomycetota bacterium]
MANVDALERITNLVALLLEARSPLTYEQIVNDLAHLYPAGEVAQRGAFERDKALLREIGVPLDSEVLGGSDAGKTAYRIERRRYELSELELTDDGRYALELAAAAARLSDADFGLLKLGAGGVASSQIVANIPQLEALPVLREAASVRSEVTFGYRGKARRLQPFALLLREGYWYVIGHDCDADAQRTYRVDRIEGLVTVGESGSFTRPDGFDARTAFPSDPKLIGDEPDARAVVLVDSDHAAAVRAELGDESVLATRGDGAIEVYVPCANVDAFRSWLFGLGSHADVIAPPEVRAAVVEWLRALAGVA